MSDVEVSNETVWPTVNDVAQTADDGKLWKEAKHTAALAAIHGQNYVISGLTVPASSANLDLAVALGTAMLSGYHVTVPGSTTITLPASSTSYIFLKLHKDGSSNVDKIQIEHNTTGTPPADSVLLATAVTSGSAVTSTQDRRPLTSLHPLSLTNSVYEWIDFNVGVSGLNRSAGMDAVWGVGSAARVETTGGGVPTLMGELTVLRALSPDLRVRTAQHGTVASTRYVGLGDTAGSPPANGIYVRHSNAGNYIAVCRSAGTESTLDTGVAAANGTFHTIRLAVLASNQCAVFVDGAPKGDITANIPSTALGIFSTENSNVVNSGLDIDFIELVMNRP
jgi:hypothetical protein